MRFVPLNSECILPSVEPGTWFVTTAVEKENSIGKFFYTFGKDERAIKFYGYSPSQLIDVKCTIVKNDLTMLDLCKDKEYNTNSIDYLLYVKVNEDKTLWPMMIEPNLKMLNIAFPYGIDHELFWDRNYPSNLFYVNNEGKIENLRDYIFHEGDRRGYMCRLKVEIYKEDNEE